MALLRKSLLWLTAMALLAAIPRPLPAAAICGNAAHWVDTCPGGTTTLSTESIAKISLDLTGDGTIDAVFPYVTLSGFTQVFLAPGSPHSFSTEIYNLQETMLTPFGATITLRAGDGIANGLNDGPLYSWGDVVEEANPLLADHSVHVMFQIDIPQDAFGPGSNAATVLQNQSPLNAVCTGLTEAPPVTCKYFLVNSFGIPAHEVLNLYDTGGEFRGTLEPAVVNGVDVAHHIVTPEPATAGLMLGLAGALVLRRRMRGTKAEKAISPPWR